MKAVTFISALFLFTCTAKAGQPYHAYLLNKIYTPSSTSALIIVNTTDKSLAIARYQIPKGAVFCRMEDKLTRLTKIWLKVGVE